jgi:DNA modification methylase
MRYFVRLVTPIGGVVMDPFAGSGTTGLAALVEGCKFVGFEQDPQYHTIAVERLRSIIEDPRQVDDEEAPEPSAS